MSEPQMKKLRIGADVAGLYIDEDGEIEAQTVYRGTDIYLVADVKQRDAALCVLIERILALAVEGNEIEATAKCLLATLKEQP